ncbi:MAG TPA: MFS transporter [Enteractinococcus sp.]
MTQKTSNRRSSSARPPVAVSLAAFSSSVDRLGVSPLLVLLALDFDVSISIAVTVASVYYFTYGLSQPVWGLLSDRFGRLTIMRIALAGALTCGLISAFAPNLVFLTIARALTGAFFGAIVPAAITYVGDTTQLAHRQSALSDLMAAIALGTAVATAMAGILGEVVNWRIVFGLSAGLALVSLLPLLKLQGYSHHERTGVWAALKLFFAEKWALFVVSLAFIEGGLVLGILTLLAPALEFQGVATSLAGLSVAAYGIATLVFSRLVRPLISRFTGSQVLVLGGCCLIVGLGIVAWHLSVVTVVIAALLLGGTWAFMHTGLQAWATQVLPEARGMTVAFFAGALFAGSAVSSGIAGTLAEAGQWTLIFGAGAACAILLTLIAGAGLANYQSKH